MFSSLTETGFPSQENPFLMLKCPTDGTPCTGNNRYEGYCADLIEKIAHIVGFHYALKEVGDKSYGSRLSDGSWNGMIGELIREVGLCRRRLFICGAVMFLHVSVYYDYVCRCNVSVRVTVMCLFVSLSSFYLFRCSLYLCRCRLFISVDVVSLFLSL